MGGAGGAVMAQRVSAGKGRPRGRGGRGAGNGQAVSAGVPSKGRCGQRRSQGDGWPDAEPGSAVHNMLQCATKGRWPQSKINATIQRLVDADGWDAFRSSWEPWSDDLGNLYDDNRMLIGGPSFEIKDKSTTVTASSSSVSGSSTHLSVQHAGTSPSTSPMTSSSSQRNSSQCEAFGSSTKARGSRAGDRL